MVVRGSLFLALVFSFLTGCGGGSSSSAPASSDNSNTNATAQAPAAVADAATITGSVKFTGTAPKAKKLSMGADAFCKTQHTTGVDAEDVVVNANKTLKNVVVYVKSGFSGSAAAPSEAAVLDQIGCLYTPHVLAVQAGQTIVIRNSDGVLHNINAKPKNNKPFNIGQPVKGMESKQVFSNPEVSIPLKCDVHPWMGGWIAVINNPHFNVTGDSGEFSLENLPPGTYELEAWHEKYGTAVQSVTVGANESKAVEFTFKGA